MSLDMALAGLAPTKSLCRRGNWISTESLGNAVAQRPRLPVSSPRNAQRHRRDRIVARKREIPRKPPLHIPEIDLQ